jgi:thymidine kinase
MVNARVDVSGRVITSGDQIFLGGNDNYIAMCHKCWKKKIKEQARRDAEKEKAATP